MLGEIAGHVDTIEIHQDLARRPRSASRVSATTTSPCIGDGYGGLPESAPFDAIVVTAAPDHVPRTLLNQLKVGGRLVLPVGRRSQMLQLWTRTERDFDAKDLIPVQFVPMTGESRREPSTRT